MDRSIRLGCEGLGLYCVHIIVTVLVDSVVDIRSVFVYRARNRI